ncbi:unnamed protein product [Musa acuminata var. zebrina]
MEQLTQPSSPVIGVVSGAAQIAYAAPIIQPAALVTGAPAVSGAIPPPAQLTIAYPTNPGNIASQHQIAYQQVPQFHHELQQQLQAFRSDQMLEISQQQIAYQQVPQFHHELQQQLQAFRSDQMLEIEETTDFKNHSLPLARIKKIMKADEDVRMISAEVPVVFAKACEMFILELTLRSWIHTEENKRRTLQKNDIAAAITNADMFDFLVDIIPRDEFKDEGFGIAGAAFPTGGSPANSVPYCFVSAPQVPDPAMTTGKPVDQTLYAVQQPHSVAYMWQLPEVQPGQQVPESE